MPKLIRPPKTADVTTFMRMLFLRTEQELIREINRKRRAGYVDYAEVASLERVQQTLQSMVDESWSYVPTMIETIFYKTAKDATGYRNARVLTSAQTAIVQQLSNNLLGQLTEASETAYKSVEKLYTIARLEADPFRETALKQVLAQEASGSGWMKNSTTMVQEIQNRGIPAFVDKAGRRWSLQDYSNMAVRTTARQAEVAAILTADDYDLWQIVKIGSTCPVCAALEGRIYSKSGTNPDYPPLTLAFGKIDKAGPDDLTNTYLNIHPNCLHSLVKYTTIGKSDKQIQKDKDFSNPEKNPLNRDPRTKKQIKAYEDKVKARQKLIRDKKQHKAYRAALGNEVPKDFAKFQGMKYNEPEKFEKLRQGVINQKKNDEFIRKIKNGEVNLHVREVKQQEHIQGTKKWKQRVKADLKNKATAPDMFNPNIDIKDLVSKYAGTGTIQFAKGQSFPVEFISADYVVGKRFNIGTGKYEDTKRFAIRYSSKGVHLHPVKEIE